MLSISHQFNGCSVPERFNYTNGQILPSLGFVWVNHPEGIGCIGDDCLQMKRDVSTTEYWAPYIDTIQISQKIPTKGPKYVSDEFNSQKRKTQDELFTSLEFQILYSSHTTHDKEKKKQRKEQVVDSKKKTFFWIKNIEIIFWIFEKLRTSRKWVLL